MKGGVDPQMVALAVDGGDDLTYGAWEWRSNALARGLAGRGVGPGDRVGLLFDGRHWADFAVADLGVAKVGTAAVHLSPGATAPELSRALSRSGAVGLLCARPLAPPGVTMWVAAPEEVERGQDTSPVAAGADPGGDADLVVDGWLVHTWAPGSLAGQHALRLARRAGATRVGALAAFDPDRLGARLAERRAVACGLTPALAAALVASGAHRRHDLTSVSEVLLSAPPSAALRAGLAEAFPRAAVVELAGPPQVSGDDVSAPVAVSQEGMLWHEQFSPGSFNLPCLVRRYQGHLDVGALEWALSEMVRRHQPLRSTFEVAGGEPRQIVRDHGGMELAVLDLSALPAPERDAEAGRLLADATGRPFDLATGALFEPRLVRLGRDDHLLVVRLHHTVFDDWSVDLFRRELSALYTARLAGAPSPLAELRTSFTDFCRRQRARLAGEAGAAQRAWWRRELDGAPLAVQLPLGPEGPGAGDSSPQAGEPLRLDLPAELAAGLRALAPRLRATPFMTVLAAFSVLVARATGQDDLVISTVVAHRNHSDLEALVGCFTKKVPLRLRLQGDPTFPELVARTRGSLLGALSNQDLAFDAAVQDGLGRPAADHGVVPQVTVVFQGETPQQVKLALPGLATGPFELRGETRRERHFSSGPEEAPDGGAAPAWGDGMYLGTFLILSLLETAEGMALVARGVFHRLAAQRLLEDFQGLLGEVVADPSRPVSELRGRSMAAEAAEDDVVDLRGLRASRSPIEAALARCPGVAEVAVAVREDAGSGPRLVAYVVAGPEPPPTLAALRHALWASLPGALWPAEMVVVPALARLPDGRLDLGALPAPAAPAGAGAGSTPDPMAALLAAMWGEICHRPVGADDSYWQDFSFLEVLAEARAAGMAIGDDQVARCRTPEMLAAAAAAAPSSSRRSLPANWGR